MRDKIKEYIKNHIKEFWLEGVKFSDEDYEFVEKLIAEGKSLEDACNEMMQTIRKFQRLLNYLDEGLDDIEK